MLIVKNTENNAIHAAQDQHTFLWSFKVPL